MKKVPKCYFISVFLLLLVLPAVNGIFGIITFERASENRVFADSLTFDVNHLDLFPEEANTYINDNFPFRTPLLNAFHDLKFYVFKTSPHPDQTVVGMDGWYFMAGKDLELYQGKTLFPKDTLQLFVKEWKNRKNYFEQKGIKVYWMIPPIKHSVYGDNLPFNIRPGKKQRLTQLNDKIDRSIPNLIVDVLPALKKHRETPMYYKQDNHWTYQAGKVVTEVLIEKLSKDFPQLSTTALNVQWRDSMVYDGIHHKVIGIDKNGEIRYNPKILNRNAKEVSKYGFTPTEGFAYPWEFERRYQNDSVMNKLKILVIRDSFGEHVMPFIPEYFAETLFIWDGWQYNLNEDIVEKYQPDIVIYLTVESNVEAIVKSTHQ